MLKYSFMAASLTVVSLIQIPSPAFSDGQWVPPSRVVHLDAADLSKEYSQSTGGVGIIMSYGNWDGAPTAEAIGERMVEIFNERGSEARYFIIEDDTPGVAMSFTTYDVGIGPFSPNDAVANIDKAIGMNEAARRLLGLK